MADEAITLGIDHLSDVREVGRGGFSVVYAATNTLLGTRVAVKVLDKLSSDRDRRRFEQECQVMGRLSQHPNVVTVHHAGYTATERPYLIMELVEGGSLADRVRAGGLPWHEAVDLIIPIGQALAYVHDAGVLHRDVKPENILISANGQPLLTDFGIARQGDHSITSTGVAASWLHAPPETFQNRRDKRSDLYSLASTLHTVIAASAPFERDNDEGLGPLMYRILHEDPPRLEPTIAPSALADVVLAGLAKSPVDRPADLTTFVDSVEALRHPPVEPVAAVTDRGGSPLPVATATSPGSSSVAAGSEVAAVTSEISRRARRFATSRAKRFVPDPEVSPSCRLARLPLASMSRSTRTSTSRSRSKPMRTARVRSSRLRSRCSISFDRRPSVPGIR
ncbi:MAG: serine/threonine-protein kinase [Actinomycetota bacterium]